MKTVLVGVCLSLCLTAAADAAVEFKTVAMNGTSAPVVVMIPAGLAMKIVSCVYEGIDTVNGVLVSPSLTYFPGTQTQGADLHGTLLKQILQQDPQGFLLAGPGKMTFNGSRSLTGGFFVNYELVPSSL
jgi:hypothetical protein